MAVKVTWLFRYVTVPDGAGQSKAGGWSETWYTTDSLVSTLTNNGITTWARARSRLLPNTTKIIGARVGEVGTGGRSRIVVLDIPGTQPSATDVPQAAMLTRLNSDNTSNFRSVMLRGLPDSWIVGGALAPVGQLTVARNFFYNYLSNARWLFRCLDLTVTQFPLVSVAADGTYITSADVTFADTDQVQVLRTVQTATGRRRGGKYAIQTFTDVRNGKLANWQWGACVKGTIRKVTYQYKTFDLAGLSPGSHVAAVRKVGRDFFQYRGRASRK